LQVNVLGTCNVLEAVRKYGCRMVFASSCEVYGTTSEVAAPEAAPLNPHSPYAASKAGADRLCYAYVKTYGLNAIIVRPCNVYGPRQKDGPGGAVIPRFVSRALRGEPLVVFGSGQQQREYMHVDDLVDGYLLLLNRTVPPGETINLGTGETPSIKETAEFIASRLNAKVTHGEARPGEVQRFTLDSSKARQLGFRPRVTFREGLDQYIQWRRSLVGR
jgi:dTDP-glucose 4,6-dehydratase